MKLFKKFIFIPLTLILLFLPICLLQAQQAGIRQPVDTIGFARYGWQMDSVMTRINRQFGIEGKMVFDSHETWQAPYGAVRVSGLREKIMNQLPRGEYIIHDSLQNVEHSLEALVPFLQYYNNEVEIVPILIPAMSLERMEGLAVAHEHEIIDNCLTGGIVKMNIKRYRDYTVQDTNFRDYKWTWCGRYSVPFGLLTAFYLQQRTRTYPPAGTLIGYSTSIDHPALPVEDLGMGVTAPANIKHWVGYAAVGYR